VDYAMEYVVARFLILRLFKIELEVVWQYVEDFFHLRHVSYLCVLFTTEPLWQYLHRKKNVFFTHKDGNSSVF
jgi:hypothetical protein